MSSAQELEVVFIPGPGIGHVVSAVEFAVLLLSRDTRVSMTLLLINDPVVREYTNAARFRSNPRLRLLNLPQIQLQPDTETDSDLPPVKAGDLVLAHKPLVRDTLVTITSAPNTRVVGFIADMFCGCMFDVADEFSIPTYLFFTSGAGFLSLILSMQRSTVESGLDLTELKGSDREFAVPGFLNPFPAKALPSVMLDKRSSKSMMSSVGRFREITGIFVNTFEELEPTVLQSLSNPINGDKIPPVYPVGPLLNLNPNQEESKSSDIITWLDQQPPSSVVFLCFGSQGMFSDAQIKHIAAALESSGKRFLWSLRRRKEADSVSSSIPDDVLLEGFLERTKGIGKVIGWAPQTEVLAHAAVGGFVSHCGWNSTLESMWFGVPMAAWPIYAEQQANAFQVVVEMGVAVEIRIDFRDDDEILVRSEEIEAAIEKLMEEGENGVRERAKEMKEKSSRAVEDGGSSHKFLTTLVDDILHNSLAQN